MVSVEASAPGKVILFGEHAVVYGQPCLSLAVDRRVRVTAEPDAGKATTVNGEALDEARHAYLSHALRLHWHDGPLRLRTESELPSASGVGSSAALSVATVAALFRMAGGRTPAAAAVARAAFETELATQGAASPNDTTVATAGGGVLLSPQPVPGRDELWRIERDERVWIAHRVDLGAMPLVVGNSGTRGRTADQVAKVRRFVERSAFAKDLVQQIGRLTLEGVDAVQARDLATVGQLMDRNHECLLTLGVGTPTLERLVKAARRVPGTYGAKLTGAGGGGSMIALARDPAAVRDALRKEGAQAFIVQASLKGFEVKP